MRSHDFDFPLYSTSGPCGHVLLTHMPVQSTPPLAGEQASVGSSTQVSPRSQGVRNNPPQLSASRAPQKKLPHPVPPHPHSPSKQLQENSGPLGTISGFGPQGSSIHICTPKSQLRSKLALHDVIMASSGGQIGSVGQGEGHEGAAQVQVSPSQLQASPAAIVPQQSTSSPYVQGVANSNSLEHVSPVEGGSSGHSVLSTASKVGPMLLRSILAGSSATESAQTSHWSVLHSQTSLMQRQPRPIPGEFGQLQEFSSKRHEPSTKFPSASNSVQPEKSVELQVAPSTGATSGQLSWHWGRKHASVLKHPKVVSSSQLHINDGLSRPQHDSVPYGHVRLVPQTSELPKGSLGGQIMVLGIWSVSSGIAAG
mmetsp:Transcript_20583/g.30537  ORF Transcript_20583/g.30537 Transcript_20583/m.30537 type:complete len:368 (+) Transcript_20583:1706-2809(+)